MPPKPIDPIKRFWAKVSISDSGCWLWTGYIDKNTGYGKFAPSHQPMVNAHRWMYEQTNGPVPEGLVLDHFKCDTRNCVNPNHLRPVTNRENFLRGTSLLAKAYHEQRCRRGHSYEEHSHFRNGVRICCRTCENERQRQTRRQVRTE